MISKTGQSFIGKNKKMDLYILSKRLFTVKYLFECILKNVFLNLQIKKGLIKLVIDELGEDIELNKINEDTFKVKLCAK